MVGNMWDAEAPSYSRMTLMEIKGTNLQLDAMPLSAEDIVLDCGCGPGRTAIQAAKRVKKVICLDSSEGMLAECRKNCAAAGVSNVEFILADWKKAQPGIDFPEVDVIIQARGGGGPTSLDKLRRTARKYAVTVMWTPGAPNLPASRSKLFVGCYSREAIERYPKLDPEMWLKGRPHPKDMPPDRKHLFPGGDIDPDSLPMMPSEQRKALARQGIDLNVVTVPEGWDRDFRTREEACEWLLPLSPHPEEVDPARFRVNVDKYLTEKDGVFHFFLPTSSDVAWFKTR